MSWGDWVHATLGAVVGPALHLVTILGLVIWLIHREGHRHIRELHAETQARLQEMWASTASR